MIERPLGRMPWLWCVEMVVADMAYLVITTHLVAYELYDRYERLIDVLFRGSIYIWDICYR